MGLSLIGVGVYTNNSGLILGGFGFIAMGFFMARFGARSQKQREELKSLAKDIGLNYSTKWWPKPGIRPGRISPILKE